MNHTKKILCLAAIVSGLSVSSSVFAHANFVENPADGSREYKENARYFLKLNLAHTCGHDGTNYDIVHSGVVFPNAADAVITHYSAMTATGGPDSASTKTVLKDLNQVLQTYDAAQKAAGANALMSIKPTLNTNWGKIIVNSDAVPAYYNHGVNTKDVRALYWVDAKNPQGSGLGMANEYAENLEFVATLGKLQNCVAKVRVFTPSIDYCAAGSAYLWASSYTTTLSQAAVTASGGKLGVSTGYAPSFDIVRSASNPLDSKCGKGEIVTIYPSTADIDKYLTKFAPDWAGKKTTSTSTQCPEGQHFMNGACMLNSAM